MVDPGAGRRAISHPDPPDALRGAGPRRVQPGARSPERGGVLHPRGPGLRDPRRAALRLGEGRPGHRPQRLGPPPLQCGPPPPRPRTRDEGEGGVDVPGAPPAGPRGPRGGRGPVRPPHRLVATVDPGVTSRKKVVKPSDTRWETTPDGRVR